jgi:hypothetical protein
MTPNDMQMTTAAIINQHRNILIALKAIVASLPNAAQIDTEVLKQRIRDPKVVGQEKPAVLDASEQIALRILGRV